MDVFHVAPPPILLVLHIKKLYSVFEVCQVKLAVQKEIYFER